MSNLLGVAVSFGAALFWGTLYAEVQGLDQTVAPFGLLAVAYVAGAVLMSPVATTQSRSILQKIRNDPKDFVACLLSLLAAEGLIFYSIELLGGTEASLLEVSYPLWTALLLFLTIGEQPTWATKVGGAMIMVGVVLTILASEQSSHGTET